MAQSPESGVMRTKKRKQSAGQPGSSNELLPLTTTGVTASDQYTSISKDRDKHRYAEDIIQVKSITAVGGRGVGLKSASV